MKTKLNLIIVLLFLVAFISCKKEVIKEEPLPNIPTPEFAAWTQAEKDLIMSGDSTEPMRVFLTTNIDDSLFLRKIAIKIKPDPNDPILKRLQQRMLVTMNAEGGVGIAGPQVGIGRDVFWCKRFDLDGKPFQFIINPIISFYSVKTIVFPYDGCLSVPNTNGATRRHSSIFVEYYNELGVKEYNILEGYSSSNFTSICFQHEFDHLRGILFTDRINSK